MHFKHKILVASAIATISAGTSHAATVNIHTESGQGYSTVEGIRTDTVTRGADLIGMQVEAVYGDGSTENLTWSAIGNNFGLIGSGFEMTYKSADMRVATTSVLKSLSFDASTANSLFDILAKNIADTYSTKQGFAFYLTGGDPLDGEIDVTYSNQIRYRNDDYQGDAFKDMTIDFSGLFGGGLDGEVLFQTDLDTLAVAGDLTAVPVPGGLPLLASGALLLGLVRRKRA